MQNRRDLAMSLVAAVASAASALAAPSADPLPSATFRFEDLPVRQSAQNKSRSVMNGITHTGYGVEIHHTEIAVGKMPHEAHRHPHEEVVALREGSLEVTIEGKVSKIGPGDVIYIASNEMHGWKNVGETSAHYSVVTLGRKTVA